MICGDLEFDMAEVSNAGLNNYVAQQATQQSQPQVNIGDNDKKKRSDTASDKSSSGVIVQISKEARHLIKAKLDKSDIELMLSKRNSQNNLEFSIISAKFRQNDNLDKIVVQQPDLYESLSEPRSEKDVLAA